MASSISIPETDYPVGTITRTVDSFPVGVSKIVITLTRVSWPGVPSDSVAKVSAIWSDGSGASASFPGGNVLGKDGQPLLVADLTVTVPQELAGGVKRPKNVISGTFTLEIFQPLTTAITIAAV